MPLLACLNNCQSLGTIALLLLLPSLSLFSKRIQSDSVKICQITTLQWLPSYSESRSKHAEWCTRIQTPITSLTWCLLLSLWLPLLQIHWPLLLRAYRTFTVGTCSSTVSYRAKSLSFIVPPAQWGSLSPLMHLLPLLPLQHSWYIFPVLFFFISLNF